MTRKGKRGDYNEIDLSQRTLLDFYEVVKSPFYQSSSESASKSQLYPPKKKAKLTRTRLQARFPLPGLGDKTNSNDLPSGVFFDPAMALNLHKADHGKDKKGSKGSSSRDVRDSFGYNYAGEKGEPRMPSIPTVCSIGSDTTENQVLSAEDVILTRANFQKDDTADQITSSYFNGTQSPALNSSQGNSTFATDQFGTDFTSTPRQTEVKGGVRHLRLTPTTAAATGKAKASPKLRFNPGESSQMMQNVLGRSTPTRDSIVIITPPSSLVGVVSNYTDPQYTPLSKFSELPPLEDGMERVSLDWRCSTQDFVIQMLDERTLNWDIVKYESGDFVAIFNKLRRAEIPTL